MPVMIEAPRGSRPMIVHHPRSDDGRPWPCLDRVATPILQQHFAMRQKSRKLKTSSMFLPDPPPSWYPVRRRFAAVCSHKAIIDGWPGEADAALALRPRDPVNAGSARRFSLVQLRIKPGWLPGLANAAPERNC